MQVTAPGKHNNHGILNRLGITGCILNIVELSEQDRAVVHFDLSFHQSGSGDAILPCRCADPQIVKFSRRIQVGYGIECGGEVRQDSDGKFYLAVHYMNFQGGRK